MPRHAASKVVWKPDRQVYQLNEDQVAVRDLVTGDDWVNWLEMRPSFAFHGRQGTLSLLKERRAGASYWYAYRRQGGRTAKQYAGRSDDLTVERLEALAQRLAPGHAAAPLLAPKLQPPRPQPLQIERGRLVTLLRDARPRAATLVCAPAGYGKTTLVRQWSEQEAGQFGVAWVGLDSRDNDPVRFWRYVVTASRDLLAQQGQAVLAQLQLPQQPAFEPTPLEAALTLFLNELLHTARPGVLVLDDYHHITTPRIHETLAFVLDYVPAHVHVVIISRSQPPLPLARLRMRGALAELTAAELRFGREETGALLAQLHVDLPPALLTQVDRQLEGWPAGLQLLALALQGRKQPAEIVAALESLAGRQRLMADYFVGEVLATQPAELQEVLLRSCVLARLSAPLWDAINGTHNGQAVLAAIEQANLFLEAVPGADGWYRFHALFAEAMHAEALRRLGKHELHAISLAASRWFEQHGMPGEAVEAALRAQHTTRAADLLVEIALIPEFGAGQTPQAAAAEFHTMRRWLDQIPDHELEARPPLLLAYATAILFAMLIDQMPVPVPVQQQIARLLERAEAGFLARGDIARLGRVFAFRSLLLREIGASEQSVVAARQALAALPPDDLVWRSIALGAVGLGALSDGNLAEAAGMLEEALACCERIGNSWWIRANLGMLSYAILERGELRKAHARFMTLLAEAREQQDADDIGRMQLALAVIAYERNELESAWEAATEAYETALRLQNHEVSIAAAVLLAQLEHVGDNQAAAQQRLYVLQAQLQGYAAPMRERLYRQVERAQALFALAQGDLAAVQQWVERCRLASEGVPRLVREREQRVLARLLLVQGTPQAALELLQPMAQAAEQEERGRCRVEIDILRMQALGALQRTDEAANILRTLIERAGPEGYVRSFLDEGPPLLELIAALARNSDSLAVRLHVRALLQHRLGAGVPAGPALFEQLTPQEMRVLGLLAEGLANAEIAQRLVVSVNTVRSQVQSIYRKLEVSNRVAAVAVARRLDLLGG